MRKTYAIILAGGKGLRMEQERPKQLLLLGDRPIIIWSMQTFNALPEIDGIIAVSHPDYMPEIDKLADSFAITKKITTVPGGETRQGSVWNALNAHPFQDDDILLFHDAARPFITLEVIQNCIRETALHGAAGVYVPAIDTIAEVDSDFVKTIPPRDKLFYTQTPQSFTYKIIREAHERAHSLKDNSATDDVSLAINAGYKVKMVKGEYFNIKITTQHDYQVAKGMIKTNQ